MSLLTRVASFAAFSLCLLGLGSITTAGQAAELTSTSLTSTSATLIAPISTLPSMTLTRPMPSITSIPTSSAPADPAIAASAATMPATRFASLEDAVAAQNEGVGTAQDEGAGALTDDIACLAGAIYFEAKGEPLSGQLAVANVILNRARSGRFPADVCGVVTQRGQFSFVRAGRMPAIAAAARGYRTAVAMARVALAAAWDSPAPKALFFHARRVGMGHGTQIATIGNHIFYR